MRGNKNYNDTDDNDDDSNNNERVEERGQEEESLHFAPCVLGPFRSREASPTTSLKSPPENLALHSVQVREAAKYLRQLRLDWVKSSAPKNFLLVHKEYEQVQLLPYIWKLIGWLICNSSLGGDDSKTTILVQSTLKESLIENYPVVKRFEESRNIRYWDENFWEEEMIDLVITVGGDGTVLTAAYLFQGVVPPIIPFHFGTVGFLNVFAFNEFTPILDKIINEGCRVNIRMRLQCQLVRAECPSRKPIIFHVLNEVSLERGASSYLALLDLLVEGHLITTVQADGLIVATPTGSTAYSLSAGGSIVHPGVPSMLVTPICPHTLSFRPLILPDSIELVLRINSTSRGSAWASFDGRNRVELKQDDSIIITSSNYPVPTVCRDDQTLDWFNGLARCLHWNDRPTSNHF